MAYASICLLIFFPAFLLSVDVSWDYVCKQGYCEKVEFDPYLGRAPNTFAECVISCYLSVWPKPTIQYEVDGIYKFCPSTIDLKFAKEANNSFLEKDFFASVQQAIPRGMPCKSEGSVIIMIDYVDENPKSSFDSKTANDGYELRIETKENNAMIQIKGSTPTGSFYGMQTLKQLFAYEINEFCMIMPATAIIVDEPMHRYRGVMLDTSRQYIPIADIKQLIATMGFYKMNVFHWHISDSHSFPLKSEKVPPMSEYGAYSKAQVYTIENLSDIKLFAQKFGVNVMIEIDMPAHTGYGFQWGPDYGLGEMVLCAGQSPWDALCLQPPCGQLNPINENMYNLIGTLFEEILMETKASIFHLGGDEVKFECWNGTQEIRKFLQDKNLQLDDRTYHELWGNFTLRSKEILKAAYTKVHGSTKNTLAVFWSSSLTSGDYLTKYFTKEDSAIMYWDSYKQVELLKNVFKNGYKMIMVNSDYSYLDCGFPHYVNDGNIWCTPYKTWQDVYNNNYKKTFEELGISYSPDQIYGGQVALWVEVGGPSVFMSKMMPRVAAAAERWWSFPSQTAKLSNQRMQYQQYLMANQMGLRTRAVAPEYCLYHPFSCYENII